MKKLGTIWVGPGQGATGLELCQAFLASAFAGRLVSPIFPRPHVKTNLALTGNPLQLYDLERIEQAEKQAAGRRR